MPLDQVLVIRLRTLQRAIALLELILIEVVYGMHLNPRMEPQSLLLALHSEEMKSARLKGIIIA